MPTEKALIIIAQEMYQDKEYEGTRKGLEAGGFSIEVASKETGECKGKYGGTEEATIAMRDANVEDYSRIAFIGGPGAGAYAEDPDALKLANDFSRTGRPFGAICVAPTILAKAHLLAGKRATVHESDDNIAILEQYSAEYTGDDVTVDGMIVTANGPDAAEEFGTTLASL